MIKSVSSSQLHDLATIEFRPSFVKRVLSKLFCYLFGEQVGLDLLPAQQRKHDQEDWNGTYHYQQSTLNKLTKPEFADIQAETFHVKTPDEAYLETVEFIHQSQSAKAPNKQNYVLYLVGNGMCFQDLLIDILEDSRDLGYNMIAFNYRNVMNSAGELSNFLPLVLDIITQIEYLRSKGIRPDNIRIQGHSFGAAIGTLAAYIYFLNGENVKLINGRSFNDSLEFLNSFLPDTNLGKLKALFQTMKLHLTNWVFSPTEYFAKIPANNKRYLVVKNPKNGDDFMPDGVIEHSVSLHKGLKSFIESHPELANRNPPQVGQKVLSYNRMFRVGHNDPLHTLNCQGLDVDAREYCRQFMKR